VETITLNVNGQNRNAVLDQTPNSCPVCHRLATPAVVASHFSSNGILNQEPEGEWVEQVLRCPNRECGHVFIARYTAEWKKGMPVVQAGIPIKFKLSALVPVTPRPTGMPPNVVALSPNFAKIFEQASTAEDMGLDEIAGVGLRKALEFLVKDYAISNHPTDGEVIKSLPLAQCITKYVKNERVLEVSKRAVWLGNDETHYIRKWEGMDLTSLKALIHLTVSWIDMELSTQEILKQMPAGKP
jgi:hypothetical protein